MAKYGLDVKMTWHLPDVCVGNCGCDGGELDVPVSPPPILTQEAVSGRLNIRLVNQAYNEVKGTAINLVFVDESAADNSPGDNIEGILENLGESHFSASICLNENNKICFYAVRPFNKIGFMFLETVFTDINETYPKLAGTPQEMRVYPYRKREEIMQSFLNNGDYVVTTIKRATNGDWFLGVYSGKSLGSDSGMAD